MEAWRSLLIKNFSVQYIHFIKFDNSPRRRERGKENAKKCVYQNDEAYQLLWMAPVSGALLVLE
jgi:hypothetical protein